MTSNLNKNCQHAGAKQQNNPLPMLSTLLNNYLGGLVPQQVGRFAELQILQVLQVSLVAVLL
jgi:hypothetical protein